MSMPIQRQSEQFSIFDDGPRYARDRSSTDLPKGLAGLINSTGPRIQAGLLNTRTAVNVDGMHPDDHAYHTELPPGPGGEIAWADDAESFGRNPRREYNPDYGYEPTDEDERRQEGVAEDDESGYNWGPEPRRASRRPFDRTAAHCPECDKPCDVEIEGHGYEEKYQEFPVSDCCGAELDDDGPDPDRDYDRWKDDQILDHDWHEGSLRPFDRAASGRLAACQECGGDVLPRGGDWEHVDGPSDHLADPDEDDIDNDEYGEGLDPARGMDAYKQHREGRRFLAFDWQSYDLPHNPAVEGHHARLENGHTLSVHQDRSKPHEGWSWGLTVPMGTLTDADGGNPQQMLNLVTGGGKNWEKINGAYATDHLPSREHAIHQAQEAYKQLYPMGTNTGGHDSGNDYSDLNSYMKHLEGRRVALAPSPQDPAMAPQVPVGGGFQAGHRVGLDWRDRTISGTVIANDGQVHIRWDEGQYTSEDPSEVHLL